MTPPSPSGEGPGVGRSRLAPRHTDTPHPNPSPDGEGLARAHRPVTLAPLPNPSPDGERAVTLAAITGAHGLGGEVRLKLFGEGVDALQRYGAFNDGGLTLASIKPVKGGAIARFAEIADRAAAERARGTALSVPRSALPPLGEGEYYHHDLIGLPATSTTGEALGTVVLVDNFGAGDVLEIERPCGEDGKPGKRFMVPMTRDAVPEWSAAGVVIDAGWIG